MIKRLLLSVLLLLFAAAPLWAQDDAGDADYGSRHNQAQFWTSVKVNKDFKHGLSLSGQYILRADLTYRMLAGHYFYAGLKYKAHKYVQLDFKFRGVNTPDRNLYRFEVGIKPRYKYHDWTFAFRLGYFNEREYFARTYERGRYPNNYLRTRIEARWDFKKNWGAYLSAEAYTLLTNRGAFVRRVAFIAGVDYSFLKMHNIDVYYLAQPDFNKKTLSVVHALSVTYTWDIPKKFKHKKKKKKD